MPRHPRARRVVKWTLTVAAVVIGAAWTYSQTRGHYWLGGDANGFRAVSLSGGSIDFAIGDPEAGRAYQAEWWPSHHTFPWRVGDSPASRWTPSCQCRMSPRFDLRANIPCWLLLALITPAVGFLWMTDRRPRPGHCRCGYSLAGLGEGVACPECGGKA